MHCLDWWFQMRILSGQSRHQHGHARLVIRRAEQPRHLSRVEEDCPDVVEVTVSDAVSPVRTDRPTRSVNRQRCCLKLKTLTL